MIVIASNLVLLIIMIYMADHGRCTGVMNNKSIWISTVISLLTIPLFVEISTALLVMMMPLQAASIISGVISFPIIFILVKVIFNKLAGIPKYQYDKSDKVFGAVFGVVKGYMIVLSLVMFYAAAFLDVALPPKVTEALKGNLVNIMFDSQIDYYRSKTFKIYHMLRSTKVSDINSSDQPDSTGRTNTLLSSLNADSTGSVTKTAKLNYAYYSWLGDKYVVDAEDPSLSLPDSINTEIPAVQDSIRK